MGKERKTERKGEAREGKLKVHDREKRIAKSTRERRGR